MTLHWHTQKERQETIQNASKKKHTQKHRQAVTHTHTRKHTTMNHLKMTNEQEHGNPDTAVIYMQMSPLPLPPCGPLYSPETKRQSKLPIRSDKMTDEMMANDRKQNNTWQDGAGRDTTRWNELRWQVLWEVDISWNQGLFVTTLMTLAHCRLTKGSNSTASLSSHIPREGDFD